MLIKIEDFRISGHLNTRLKTRLVNTRNICEVRKLQMLSPARKQKWHAFEVVYSFGHSSYFYFTERKSFEWALRQLTEGA